MKYKILAIIALVSFILGGYVGSKVKDSEKEIEIKEVTKVEIRERVVTKIKEHPDGTRETIIVRDTEETSNRSRVEIVDATVKPKVSIWAGAGMDYKLRSQPVYTFGVDKHIAVGFSAGAYFRTDKELGLTLRYSF